MNKMGNNRILTFAEAAIKVLRSEGQPMTGNKITTLAIQRGLIHTKGKTPMATLISELYVGIRNANFPIERLAEPGTNRAKRGSVRWKLKAGE